MSKLLQGGPILANTVYANNKLTAENVAVSLPTVTFGTSDYNALGTLTLPNKAALEAMEFSLTKPGIGKDLATLGSPEIINYEVRGAQDELQPDGTMKTIGFKAFIRAVSGGLPGIEISIGEQSENQVTGNAIAYRLIVDGSEICNIDRTAQKLVINGKDYYKPIVSLL
jgi:phage tail tube protein FII